MGKKKSPKLPRLAALMILSQVFLVCFMAYWLRSEYRGAEEALRKQLALQLERSQERISDSVVMATILKPAAEEDSGRQRPVVRRMIIHGERHGDPIPDSTFIVNLEEQVSKSSLPGIKQSQRKVVFYQNDTGEMFRTGSARNNLPSGTILRAVRSLVKASDNVPDELRVPFILTDTGILSKAFIKDLGKEDIRVRIRWLDASQQQSKSGIQLSSFSTPGYRIEVTAYRGRLLREMTPQVLITLILLSLTAAAFFVTYRSLRAQTHLAAIRNDLISNMSHELKTPVSTVKVALEAISEPEVLQDLPKARDYIRMASLEIGRLELLINQALQSSLLEDGNIHMQQEPVDLSVLIKEVAGAMQPRFAQQDSDIDIAIIGDDLSVPADKLLVQGVVINILDNALKYAGAAPAVKISAREEGGHVILSIRDKGPGIPDAYAGRIFDKFFRVPRGNEHSVKGYGLGLSYAAQVMALHGGSISMETPRDGGCNFILRFRKAAL